MKIRLFLALCCVLLLSDDVFAEGGIVVKRGQYQFMAFLYYPDETIIESTGLRFQRGAVLVKPDWLITTSVGPVMINGTLNGFPWKTLLVRLGAVSIDANFTLNEDEDEQEREVIQIVHPYNQSEAQWWRNEVTLLRTLVPFNLTSAVGTATIRTKSASITNSNCFMLVYAKIIGNWTEERLLMKLSLDLQFSSMEACGNHFYKETMLCANDSEESKNDVYDPEFCRGNSGGPLICEGEVAGLQTYIENNCKQPHLYQRLSAWDNFITCGIEDKCNEEQCGNMCTLINKDDAVTQSTTVEEPIVHLVSAVSTVSAVSEVSVTQTEEITIISHPQTESTTDEDDTPTAPPVPTLTTASEQPDTPDTTTTTTTTASPTTNATYAPTTDHEETESTSWPKVAKSDEDEDIKVERKTDVEAHRQNLKVKKRNSAGRHSFLSPSLLTVLIVFCFI